MQHRHSLFGSLLGAVLLVAAPIAAADEPTPQPAVLGMKGVSEAWVKLNQAAADRINAGRAPDQERYPRPEVLESFDALTRKILQVMSRMPVVVTEWAITGVDPRGMEWKLSPRSGLNSTLETCVKGGQSKGGRSWTVDRNEHGRTTLSCFFRVGENPSPRLRGAGYAPGDSARRNIYLYSNGAYTHELVTRDHREGMTLPGGRQIRIPGVVYLRTREPTRPR